MDAVYVYHCLKKLIRKLRKELEEKLSGFLTEEESIQFRSDIEEFLNQTEEFRDEAEQFKNLAEGFRDESEGYKDEAEGFKDESEQFRNQAEGFRNEAEGFRDESEQFRDDAVFAKEAAELAASMIDGSGEVEEGEIKLVSGGKVFDFVSPLTAELEKLSQLIVSVPKKNLLNPENFDFTKRYSSGGADIRERGSTIYAGSGYIPVEEGKWYIFSIRDGVSVIYPTGAFCTSEGQTSGLIQIDYVTPVDGIGRCFQVPIGLGITHVYLNLICVDTASNVLDGNHQLEEGEQATEYEEYQQDKIDPKYLPETTISTVDDKQYEKYTTFGNLSYAGISDRISNFRKHWIAKDKDLVVVNTGTSLTARSVEHCTEHPKANERPPLMHSYNFASHIWDKLKWEGQRYRRYDYPGFFTEVGSFQTQANVAEWDDGAYRNGLTRFSDGNAASIEFQIPVGAWQFNFIYRSDSVSSEVVTVDIAEGNGKVEVWNGSAWVEANGYTFSQKEPPVVQLASIINVNPETGGNQTLNNYQVKGNTTYQKRLKMRCKSGAIDSRSEEKTVTISASTGRLTYWGVEWSVREHMITFINAARSSHSSLITSSATNLSKYQDNEIWSFEPDLLITEDPIHNSGAAGNLNLTRPKAYYARVTENFFFNTDNSVSIVASADRHSLPVPEMVIFNSSIAWNYNGIDDDGELIIYNIVDGQWTALDAQMSCWEHVTENYPDVIYINAVKTWVEAGRAIFGDLKTATSGSGKNGKTFTDEGSHWNETGSRIMARVVLPVLDFYTN